MVDITHGIYYLDMTSEKKKPLTPKEKAVCANLNRIWQRKKSSLGLTQGAAGAALGMSQGGFSHLLAGRNKVRTDHIPVLAEMLDCRESEIDPDWKLGERSNGNNVVSINANSKNIIIVPRLDVAGSMGNGLALPSQHIDVVESMKVSKEYLARTVSYSNASNLAIITGYGDSMEGTFSDGDLLLVDRGVNDLKVDAVYVLALGDELYIKRIQRRPDGSMAMLSDNPKYQPYEIKNGEAEKFQVLGRVLLAWNANKL